MTVLVTLFVPLGPLMHFDAPTQQYLYNSALVQRHKSVLNVEDLLRYFRDIVQVHKKNLGCSFMFTFFDRSIDFMSFPPGSRLFAQPQCVPPGHQTCQYPRIQQF